MSHMSEGDKGKIMTLAEAERNHILVVLYAFKENVSETARVLGMHRRTLQRKLAKIREEGKHG